MLRRSAVGLMAASLLGVVACGNADPGASTPEAKEPSPAPAPATLEVVRFELRDASGHLNPGGNHYARGRIPWFVEIRGADNTAHIPQLGRYELELMLRDEVSERETNVRETIVIQ